MHVFESVRVILHTDVSFAFFVCISVCICLNMFVCLYVCVYMQMHKDNLLVKAIV